MRQNPEFMLSEHIYGLIFCLSYQTQYCSDPNYNITIFINSGKCCYYHTDITQCIVKDSAIVSNYSMLYIGIYNIISGIILFWYISAMYANNRR